MTTLHEKHRDWLTGRGIDPALADKFGLKTVERDGAKWLAVPYPEHGKIVNHKYRLTSRKDHRMDQGAPLTLWNHDVLLTPEVRNGSQRVIITEGEWDAMIAIQSGFPHTVSVPNGATLSGGNLSYIERSIELLRNVKTFLLATDDDEAGYALRGELARLLGPARCQWLEYPEGCKDLNDIFMLDGVEGVRARIDHASKPYPIQGLFTLDEIPEPAPLKTIPLGVPGLSEMLSFVPGTLTILTGYPGHGKTSLTMAMLASVMQAGISVAVASFETMAKPVLHRRLRSHLLGCGEYQLPVNRLPEADAILRAHLTLIMQSVDDDEAFDVDRLLDLAATAVIRNGTRLLFIDPWNEIEHKRKGDETTDEYIGRALRAIKRFARDYDVAVWLVAHPKKPDPGYKVSAPGLSSISGSMNFANKADYGLSCHRPNKATPNDNTVEVSVNKVRMGLPGKEGRIMLGYDWRVSGYYNTETGESL